ncbi:MAG TPA: metallopeptidase TldD-related protein [Bacteroidota bacterium]|nr:metallopeptidase TldD-related protein [Bacteroidota bacterium]
MKRRDFVKLTAASGAAFILPGSLLSRQAPSPQFSDPDLRVIADEALNSARMSGASYADIRINRYRNQSIATREQRVTNISNNEEYGFGIRVIVEGTWGFAASNIVTKEEVARVAKEAVLIAKANSVIQKEPVKLAPVPSYQDVWKTPIKINPFDIPVSDKVGLLLQLNQEALKTKGVSFCTSSMQIANEQKFFASTEGSYIEQELYRMLPSFTVTSVNKETGRFESRNSLTEPIGKGYECVDAAALMEDVRLAAQESVMKHSAMPVVAGKHDLILHPTNLWLTIHESIGHPTELDRALGYEANYAGTSFMTTDKLGKLKVGSEIVNIVADKTQKDGLATCGYDDDGVKTKEWHLIKDGMFVGYQTIRDQAHLIGETESTGCCYADSWSSIPFQRMPNVSLRPGRNKLTLDQLIADTEDAIMIKGRGSWSIDHQRYNFQFGGQTFWEIKKGKITQMLRDVAYQANTVEFWSSCDAICSADEYYLGGSFSDGKGEPGQSNSVSHGACPARFRQVNVLNTGRKV